MFQPTYKIKSVLDLSAENLINQNIKLAVFDADCTLISDKAFFIEEKMLDKLKEIEKSGIKIIIASNGKIHRINKVFKNHPVKAYPMCLKPLPWKLAAIIKNYDRKQVVLIGDQYFTDILCALFLGIRSYMVAPYGEQKGSFLKIKRFLEKHIVGDYTKWE